MIDVIRKQSEMSFEINSYRSSRGSSKNKEKKLYKSGFAKNQQQESESISEDFQSSNKKSTNPNL